MKQKHRENLNWAAGLATGITHAISGENGEEIKFALRAIVKTIKEVLDETEEEGDEQRKAGCIDKHSTKVVRTDCIRQKDG